MTTRLFTSAGHDTRRLSIWRTFNTKPYISNIIARTSSGPQQSISLSPITPYQNGLLHLRKQCDNSFDMNARCKREFDLIRDVTKAINSMEWRLHCARRLQSAVNCTGKSCRMKTALQQDSSRRRSGEVQCARARASFRGRACENNQCFPYMRNAPTWHSKTRHRPASPTEACPCCNSTPTRLFMIKASTQHDDARRSAQRRLVNEYLECKAHKLLNAVWHPHCGVYLSTVFPCFDKVTCALIVEPARDFLSVLWTYFKNAQGTNKPTHFIQLPP